MSALFYHLVAVAIARLDQMKQAREQWQQALKRSPGFPLTQANLDDLKQPMGLRHAPWSFSFSNWVTKQIVDDLAAIAQSTAKSQDETQMTTAAQRYLTKHPQVAHLVPLLLDRGDPPGREFAFRLASVAKTPEMLAALRDFALSQRGPDEMRHQAAIKVSEAGLLSSEAVRMWLQGEWRELNLISYEFHEEPTAVHSPQVKKWVAEALSLMKTRDAKEAAQAESLLKQALEVEPEAPDLLNNLAGIYEIQGRTEEAHTLMRQVAESYPDYVFARVSVARLHFIQGEINAAEALLKPLLARKRFHFNEFAAFSNVYIELLLAQKHRDGARAWLNMWEGVDPEHPDIMNWKLRLEEPNLLPKLSKFSKWGWHK